MDGSCKIVSCGLWKNVEVMKDGKKNKVEEILSTKPPTMNWEQGQESFQLTSQLWLICCLGQRRLIVAMAIVVGCCL